MPNPAAIDIIRIFKTAAQMKRGRKTIKKFGSILFCPPPPPQLSENKFFNDHQAHVLFSYIVTCKFVTGVIKNTGAETD